MSTSRLIPDRVFRLVRGHKLSGYGDPVGESPILFMPLRKWQEDTVGAMGLTLTDVRDETEIKESKYFIFDEDIFFTKSFLKSVLAFDYDDGMSKRFCLRENTFNERFVLPYSIKKEDHLKFNFFYINKEKPEIEDVLLEQKLYENYITLPYQIVKGGKYHYDQCELYITRIASPFHLLHANLAVNLSRTIQLQKLFPKWIIEKFGRADSKMFYRSLKFLNKIGKGCRIHPSAKIEGSILGDNVTVGANAIVRLSVVADNAILSDNVSILNSVLDKGTTIFNGNCINLCLTYENVFLIHGPYQFSVFGRNSAVFATINCDIRLDEKTIAIPTDVGVLDSKQQLLGIAYGHHSKVGGGNIIAPGRVVPNNRHINPPPSIILKFE